MGGNPLVQLHGLGQSVWLDFVSRGILKGGKLRKLIEEDSITGVTSNPSIFQKAISGGKDYDEAIKAQLKAGVVSEKEIFIALAIEDIAEAADQLKGIYEKTGGDDGYVSIEVSPDLAYDTKATVKEAHRLFLALNRKNILIKVPATKEGLPAIERLISDGVNVNVTLLFSVDRYMEVTEAYLAGLEARLGRGEPIEDIASVASFFVSRVDTLVDKLLSGKDGGRELMGKAAVANAKLAYAKGREVFLSSRFQTLREKGARTQRLLWGSTGTKNPEYSDIKYVEEIIAPDTVNTLPEATIDAFRDHGKPRVSIEEGMDDAKTLFLELSALGIDIDKVTAQLEEEGVKAFKDSFFALLEEIGRKKAEL